MNILKQLVRLLMLATVLVLNQHVLAADIESPTDMLKKASDKVIVILVEQRDLIEAEPNRLFDIVQQYIIPHLDDVTMAKLALGKNWRKADNDQKIIFVDEFRELLVRTYGKSLKEFKDQTINFFPVKLSADSDKAVVKSEVLQPGGPTIPISYKMRVKNNEWKVYDISIDGVSLVTSYRGTFAQEIRKGGIEGLLTMLRDRNKRSKT